MDYEKHDAILQKEFESLSYELIEKILDELGLSFENNIPLASIDKSEIYWTIENDYSIERINDAIKKVNRDNFK